MKKLSLISVLIFITISTFAQNYSFSIAKSGVGEQTIILIPGFACSGEVWNETVERLNVNNTCYVLTMAGFGGVVPEENPSFETWKTQIAKFIIDRKIEKPIIIGHSMGGGLALAIASDYPNLTKKIVVVDALPCLMALMNPNFRSVANDDYSDRVNQMVSVGQEQFTQMQKMSVQTLTTDTSKFEKIVDWGVKSDRKTYAKMYCDFSNTDLRESITNITVPTLVLLESNFKHVDTAIKEQYKNLSTAQFKYANKGLHFLMYDDSEWFNNQVFEFVKE